MKILVKICAFLSLIFAFTAYSASVIIEKQSTLEEPLKITTYSPYFPFGYEGENNDSKDLLKSVFRDVLSEFDTRPKRIFSYRSFDSLKEAVLDVKSGKTQVFMGAFYTAEEFDYIFPAILNNPVHLMMLPDKITNIHKAEDLKKLKGIYLQTEPFAPHILNIFKQLSLTPVADVDEAYKQVLTGQADYMLGSYFYHYAQVVERGLKGYIVFSARPLWNMPMFIALSKQLKDSKNVREYFTRLVTRDFHAKIVERIKVLMQEKEQKSIGVVPPAYINQNAQQELTPADETTPADEPRPVEEGQQ